MKKVLLCLLLVYGSIMDGWDQQVIGSFPQMDGGFESQLTIPLTSTTIPNGVQRIDWTVQNNSGTSVVMASGGRSGPKYVSFSATTTRKLQSPTADNQAVQNGTPYTIQFYYRSTSAATNSQVGVSTDGTGYPGTYISVALPSTGGIWNKITQSATGATSNANPRYGIGVIRFNGASGTTIGIDDFVMYAGSVDITPPAQPGPVVLSNCTGTSVDISWGAAPGGTDGGGYMVVRYKSMPVPSDDPNPNGIYSVGSTVLQLNSGIVRYSGTGLSFTDLGLTAGTIWYYKIYTVDKAFNYSIETEASYASPPPVPVTYTWTGPDNADWTIASNWDPVRTVSDTIDILAFDGGTVKTITNVPAQTIGQMLILGNTSVTLTSENAVTLSLRGIQGTGLTVASGSQLTLNGNNAITLALTAGAAGHVDGSILQNGSTIATAHRITAADVSGLTFASGSIFTAGTQLAGNPFGTGTPGSVLFQSGSKFISKGGSNPFALNQPTSVAVFQHGSLYKHMTTGWPSVSGRTYADFELDNGCNGDLITVAGIAPLVMDNLILTTGDIAFGMTGGMTINGNIVTNEGTALAFNPSSLSSLAFSGSAVQSVSGNGTITIGNNANVLVGNSTRIEKDILFGGPLTISSGQTLTIAPGIALRVEGSTIINQPEGLVLLSDSSGTASFVDNGTISGTGTVRMEKFLSGYGDPSDRRYHFLSSPVSAQPVCPEFVSLPNTTDDFYKWDEPTNSWINSKDNGGNWLPSFESCFSIGRGYLVAYPQDQEKVFRGIPNTFPESSPLNLPCTWTSWPPGNEGWNLEGNPFPSPIDWTLVIKGDGIGNALYYYDPGIQNYRYYVEYLPGISAGNGSRYIPAMQGFMIHANSAGSSRMIILNNSMRVSHPADLYYKSTDPENSLRLTLEGNGFSDETFIYFHEQATAGVDGSFDAYKLLTANRKIPVIYTTADQTALAVNSLPNPSSPVTVPLMVSFPEDGYYRIIAYGTGSFPSGTQILLEDPLAGRILDLAKTPEYIFEGQKIDKPLCFYLLFYGAAFGTDPDYQKGIRIYASGNRIFIHSQVPEKDSRVLIYNLLGQLLAMEDLQEQPVNSFEIAGCTGVCFVKVISSRGTAMKKVMLE